MTSAFNVRSLVMYDLTKLPPKRPVCKSPFHSVSISSKQLMPKREEIENADLAEIWPLRGRNTTQLFSLPV